MRPYSLRPLAHRGLLGDLLLFPGWYPRRLAPCHAPHPHLPLAISQQQRRRFWGRQRAPAKEPPNTIPGVSKIGELVRSLNTQEGRPPTDDVLVDAFRRLVASWKTGVVTVLDEHVHGLTRTYEYLRGSPRGVRIPPEDVRVALRALQDGTTPHQAALARVLFGGLVAEGEPLGVEDVVAFVRVLCGSGNTAEAVEITRRYGETLGEAGAREAWERVLEGFAREGDEETLLQTWELLKSLGVELTPRVFQSLVRFYCGRGELERAKGWYERIQEAGLVPTLRTTVDVLAVCVEKRELGFGREIVNTVLAGGKKSDQGSPMPVKSIGREEWDVVLQWTTLLGADMEKGLKRTDWLIELMAQGAIQEEARPEPNIDTMNGLIQFAIARKDSATAGHFLHTAMKKGYEYNRTTMELQIEHRLLTNDIQGARVVYEELRREYIPQGYEGREAKRLLCTLCKDEARDMEQIQQVYLDLNDWAVKLDVDTLTTLLAVFLEKCNFQAVIELLNRDCHGYSAADRRKVIHEIGEYIGRSTTSIEAAWDSYQILYQFFPELSVRQRTDIMRLFFELGRSDMATVVFHHMRGTPGRRPDKYTYSIALMGVAYSRDLDALQAVHNALKLDHFVDLDTLLINSLMTGYNHCGIPERALQFWEDIKKSREGPNYASISIVLDTCGNLRYGGSAKAKIIWCSLRAMGVKPSLSNYCSYVEALGRNGDWGDSWRVVMEMEALDGVRPDFKL